MSILMLCHALAVIIWVGFVNRNAHRDFAAITADGAADTLHQTFHRQRLTMRVGAAVGLVLLANTTAWPSILPALGLLAFCTGYFAWRFNTLLSTLRGLDPFYLSAAPNAAFFPDRLLTKLGWGLKPVLLVAVWAGLAAEIAGLAWHYASGKG